MKWLLKLYSCNGVILASAGKRIRAVRNGASDNGIDDFHWLRGARLMESAMWFFGFPLVLISPDRTNAHMSENKSKDLFPKSYSALNLFFSSFFFALSVQRHWQRVRYGRKMTKSISTTTTANNNKNFSNRFSISTERV